MLADQAIGLTQLPGPFRGLAQLLGSGFAFLRGYIGAADHLAIEQLARALEDRLRGHPLAHPAEDIEHRLRRGDGFADVDRVDQRIRDLRARLDIGFLDPGDMFSVNLSVLIVLFALFGGRRSWIGPLLGAAVAIALTVLVYGAVAILVKMDDVGLKLARDGGSSVTRSFGRGLVKAMPVVMKVNT